MFQVLCCPCLAAPHWNKGMGTLVFIQPFVLNILYDLGVLLFPEEDEESFLSLPANREQLLIHQLIFRWGRFEVAGPLETYQLQLFQLTKNNLPSINRRSLQSLNCSLPNRVCGMATWPGDLGLWYWMWRRTEWKHSKMTEILTSGLPPKAVLLFLGLEEVATYLSSSLVKTFSWMQVSPQVF